MLTSGTKVVAAAGTRERIAAVHTPAAWVTFQATGGGGAIYVGGSTVSSTVGSVLLAGSSLTLPSVGDLNLYDLYEIWIDAAVSADGVKFNYGTH